MNAELILLPCYRHHWYGRISPPRRNPSSREQEGRKEKDEEEEVRDDRIFPNKSLHHGIRNRMYALRGQRARYSLVDRRWSIHLTWRSVTRLEYLDRKKNRRSREWKGEKKKMKRNWKKNWEKSFYTLSYMWKFGNFGNQNFHLRRYVSARIVVGWLSSCIDHDVACFSIMKRAELVSYNRCRWFRIFVRTKRFCCVNLPRERVNKWSSNGSLNNSGVTRDRAARDLVLVHLRVSTILRLYWTYNLLSLYIYIYVYMHMCAYTYTITNRFLR